MADNEKTILLKVRAFVQDELGPGLNKLQERFKGVTAEQVRLNQATEKYDEILRKVKETEKHHEEVVRKKNETESKHRQILDDLHAATNKYERQLDKLNKTFDSKNVGAYRSQVAKLREEITNSDRDLNKFDRALRQLEDSLKKGNANAFQFKQGLQNLRKAFLDTDRDIRVYNETLKQNTKAHRDHQSEITRSGRLLDQFGRQITNTERSMRSLRSETQAHLSPWQKFSNSIDDAERGLSRLASSSRGLIIIGLIKFAQSFATILVSLGANLVSVAGSATMAGAAIGGVFVSGVAQALPVLGLLVATFQRLQVVMQAVSLGQKALQQQSTGAATEANKHAASVERNRDAHDQLKASQEAVANAQRGLTEARRRARHELEDLIIAEKKARIESESSVLSQQESQRSLEQAVRSGNVAEVQRARLEVRSSNLDVQSSALDQSRTSAEARRARAAGIPGSEAVRDATRALEEAKRAADNAQRGLRIAGSTAADVANQGVAANRQLNFLMSNMSESEKKLTSALTRLRNNFEKQSKRLVAPIIDAFTDVANRVNKIFEDTRVVRGFSALAKVMADSIGTISKELTNTQNMRAWLGLLNEATKNAKPLTDIFISLSRVLRNIAIAAAPALSIVLSVLKTWAGDAEKATSNTKKLSNFFMEGLKHLKAWVDMFAAIGKLFLALTGSGGGADAGLTIIQKFTKEINKATKWVEDHPEKVQKFFRDSIEVLGQVGKVLKAIGAAALTLFNKETVEPFVEIMVDLLIPSFVAFIKVMGLLLRIVNAIFDIPLIGPFLKNIVLATMVVTKLGGAFVVLGGVLKPFWILVAGPLRMAIFRFATAIQGLTLAMVRAKIATIAAAVASRAMMLIPWVAAISAGVLALYLLIKNWDKVKETAKNVLKWISDHWYIGGALAPAILAIKLVAKNFDRIKDAAKDVLNFFKGAWGKLKDFIRDPFKGLGDFVKGVFNRVLDGIKAVMDKVLGAITSALDIALKAKKIPVVGDKIPGLGGLENLKDDINQKREELRGESDDSESRREKRRAKARDEHTHAIRRQGKASKDAKDAFGSFGNQVDELGKQQKRTKRETDKANDSLADQRAAARRTARAHKNVAGSAAGLAAIVGQAMDVIAKSTNAVLGDLGAKTLKFAIGNLPDIGKTVGTVFNALGFAGGGVIPGQGMMDTVPLVLGMAAPGEAILTRHQQDLVNHALAATYGMNLDELFRTVNRPHYMAQGGFIPGYAEGGKLGGPFGSGSGHIPVAKFAKSKFGISPTSGRTNHSATTVYGGPSDHAWGGAVDYSNGVLTKEEDAFSGFWKQRLPQVVKQLIWRNKDQFSGYPIGGHEDHVHLALQRQYAFDATTMARLISRRAKGLSIDDLLKGAGDMGSVAHIPKLKFKGPAGAFKNIVTKASELARKAANTFLDKKGGAMTFDGGSGETVRSGNEQKAKGWIDQALDILGIKRERATWESMLLRQAFRESGYDPNVVNTWDSNAAAGHPSKGFLQTIQPTFDSYKIKGHGNILNPVDNTIAAVRYMISRYGGGNQHRALQTMIARGGGGYARGGFLGGKRFATGGGIRVPGTKSRVAGTAESYVSLIDEFKELQDAAEIIPRLANAARSAARSVKRIKEKLEKAEKRNDKDDIKELEDDLKKAEKTLKDRRKLLGKSLADLTADGGPLDNLRDAFDKMIASMALKVKQAAFKMMGGIAVRNQSPEQIAAQELTNLGSQREALTSQRSILGDNLVAAQKALKKAKTKTQKQDAQAAITKIQEALGQVDEAIAQNIEDTYQKQIELIQTRIDTINRSTSNSQRNANMALRLADLSLSGRTDFAAKTSALQDIGGTLQTQKAQLVALMNDPIVQGNAELTDQLKDQLADLEVSIAENTKAVEDNIDAMAQFALDIISSRQQFAGGITSGLMGILQTMGNISGNPNVALMTQILTSGGAQLQSTKESLASYLLSRTSGFSGTGVDVTGLTGEDLINYIASLDFNAITSNMSETDAQRFQNLINQIIENDAAIYSNTEQLMQLNGQLQQPQTFATSSWQMFRQAVFNGLGGLMPQYQALVPPTANVSLPLPPSGPAAPGTFNPDTLGGTNVYVTNPTEVADPVYLGQRVAWELKGTRV